MLTKRRLAWIMLILSLIGWPISAWLTWDTEPQFVLGLSWLAIIVTCIDTLWIAQVEEKQDAEDG